MANRQLHGSLIDSLKPNPVEAESQIEDFELQYTPSKKKRGKFRASSGLQDRDESQDILQAGTADVSFVGEQQNMFRIKERNGASDQTLELKGIEKQQIIPNTTEVPGTAGARSDIDHLDHVPIDPSNDMSHQKPHQNSIEVEDITKPTTTPTSTPRKRGRPRKLVQSAATPQDKTDVDLAFKKTPTKDRILDDQASIANTREKRTRAGPAPLSSSTMPLKEHQPLLEMQENEASPSQITNGLPTVDDFSDEDQNLEHATSELCQLIQKDDSGSLKTFKAQILEGLTGKRRLPLVNLDQEYQKVHQIVAQTVLAGEGNSALIIGSRGTAKSTLVETVIADLALDHRDVFHVVRLNGFIHTDDKLALREIWRQLGREMEVEDDSMAGKSNYADTLTSFLALLSHSTEEDGADQTAKSVIFILDEFDLFASHPRQTLLYNLFDVAQSRNAPIIVLGLTTKVDVVDSLEKRVKSRFGQRYIHLPLPRSLTSFHAICKSALIPPTNISTRFNPATAEFQKLRASWKKYVNALFAHDQTLSNFLQTLYTRSKSIPEFLTAAILPISLLSATSIPTGRTFSSQALLAPDSKLHLLPSLSDCGLALLIAAARLDILLDSDTCTFGMAHDEYVQLASKVKLASSAAGQTAVGAAARVWGREVAREAWDILAALELVLPVGAGKAGSMWRVDVALEEIAPSVPGLDAVMVKWCKEL